MDWSAIASEDKMGPCVRVFLMDGAELCLHPDIADRFGHELVTAAKISTCDHEWIDARNSVVESGHICRKCGALKP